MVTTITDNADVEYVNTILGDAIFRPDAITYDYSSGNFSVQIWVLETVEEDRRRWRAYTLSFRDVLECQVSKREDVSHCEFSRLNYVENAGKLELITHYAVDIVLSTRSLDGLLSRTDDTRDLEKKEAFPWTYSWDNL